MTDVLASVLVPYTRFLEVRARRLDIDRELAQPNASCRQTSPHDSEDEKPKPRTQGIVGD